MTEIERVQERIYKLAGESVELDDLLERLVKAARRDGMEDLVIDLVDAGEIGTETREFIRQNNGV